MCLGSLAKIHNNDSAGRSWIFRKCKEQIREDINDLWIMKACYKISFLIPKVFRQVSSPFLWWFMWYITQVRKISLMRELMSRYRY